MNFFANSIKNSIEESKKEKPMKTVMDQSQDMIRGIEASIIEKDNPDKVKKANLR